MLGQYLADENQADTLSVRLGGKEGAEKLGFHLAADSFPGIGYLQRDGRGGGTDVDIATLTDTFRCILDDVHQYLLKQDGIYPHRRVLGTKFVVQGNPAVTTHRLHKHPASGHSIIQTHLFQTGFRYLYHVGEVGDETAHPVTTLHTHFHYFLYILGIFHVL